MAVHAGRRAVSGPPGVGNAAVRIEGLGKVELRLIYELLELGNLADLLEGVHLLLLVAIDGKTGRIVAAVLETGETCIAEQNARQRLAAQKAVGQSWFQPGHWAPDIPLMSVSIMNFRSFSTR